jgi:hypothetical protein
MMRYFKGVTPDMRSGSFSISIVAAAPRFYHGDGAFVRYRVVVVTSAPDIARVTDTLPPSTWPVPSIAFEGEAKRMPLPKAVFSPELRSVEPMSIMTDSHTTCATRGHEAMPRSRQGREEMVMYPAKNGPTAGV